MKKTVAQFLLAAVLVGGATFATAGVVLDTSGGPRADVVAYAGPELPGLGSRILREE